MLRRKITRRNKQKGYYENSVYILVRKTFEQATGISQNFWFLSFQKNALCNGFHDLIRSYILQLPHALKQKQQNATS